MRHGLALRPLDISDCSVEVLMSLSGSPLPNGRLYILLFQPPAHPQVSYTPIICEVVVGFPSLLQSLTGLMITAVYIFSAGNTRVPCTHERQCKLTQLCGTGTLSQQPSPALCYP